MKYFLSVEVIRSAIGNHALNLNNGLLVELRNNQLGAANNENDSSAANNNLNQQVASSSASTANTNSSTSSSLINSTINGIFCLKKSVAGDYSKLFFNSKKTPIFYNSTSKNKKWALNF